MKISIIILQYNINKELVEITKDCITSFRLALQNHDHEIIIVDNNSPIKDKEIIKSADIYLQRKENNSVAQAFNEGVAKSTGDIICHSDNDVLVAPDWALKLKETFRKDKDCSVVGFMLAKDKEDLFFSTEEKDRINGMPAGCLFAMKRKVFEALNGFDENFKVCYYDDGDFLLRVLKTGFKIRMCYNNKVYHYLSRTTKDKEYRAGLHTARTFNQGYFKGKHGGICKDLWKYYMDNFSLYKEKIK